MHPILDVPKSSTTIKAGNRWLIISVLSLALYIRMVLAFFPGYPDTNDFVRMVVLADKGGLAGITDWGGDLPQYPPGFIYQARIASKAINKLTHQPPPSSDAAISPLARLGVKIGPILCDIFIAICLYWSVARINGGKLAALAASLYLFNPGVIANSALWNFDAIPSFLMLLSLLFCGLAFEKPDDRWLTAGVAACALAFCVKLQAGMLIPIVGTFVLLRRKLRPVITAAIVFSLICVLAYLPFLLGKNWDYFHRVFVASFEFGQLTHFNAYNAWALWFQIPANTKILGLSCTNIGRLSYLACAAVAIHALFTNPLKPSPHRDAVRRFSILGAYLCIAPFLLFTQMHERYMAYAIALTVLAGFLDQRLRFIAIGFSLTYALNMVAVGMAFWHPWGLLPQSSDYYEPVRLLFIVNRIFCSLVNCTLFAWFTVRIRGLVATNPNQESVLATESDHPAAAKICR